MPLTLLVTREAHLRSRNLDVSPTWPLSVIPVHADEQEGRAKTDTRSGNLMGGSGPTQVTLAPITNHKPDQMNQESSQRWPEITERAVKFGAR